MSERHTEAIYRVHLDHEMNPSWFESFNIIDYYHDKGHTILTSRIIDQAQLYSLLRVIRDSGVSIISIEKLNE